MFSSVPIVYTTRVLYTIIIKIMYLVVCMLWLFVLSTRYSTFHPVSSALSLAGPQCMHSASYILLYVARDHGTFISPLPEASPAPTRGGYVRWMGHRIDILLYVETRIFVWVTAWRTARHKTRGVLNALQGDDSTFFFFWDPSLGEVYAPPSYITDFFLQIYCRTKPHGVCSMWIEYEYLIRTGRHWLGVQVYSSR